MALLASVPSMRVRSTLPKSKLLVYSLALSPIPAKALDKIYTGSYLDLKELLPDNAALLQHLQELGQVQQGSSVKLCEISNPLTWVFCFLSFMVAKSESKEARELISYAQIIVQMARRHRGSGWLLYDQNF